MRDLHRLRPQQVWLRFYRFFAAAAIKAIDWLFQPPDRKDFIMGHVVINSGAVANEEVAISTEAADAVRLKFNPSGMHDVDVLKSLAAAFYSECAQRKQWAKDEGDTRVEEDMDYAMTCIRTASMFAVAAATANMP